jgi:hypothetical protein
MGFHRKPVPSRLGMRLRNQGQGFESGCWSLLTDPVKEGAGWVFLVWDDRFHRGGSRCANRGSARGLFFDGIRRATWDWPCLDSTAPRVVISLDFT